NVTVEIAAAGEKVRSEGCEVGECAADDHIAHGVNRDRFAAFESVCPGLARPNDGLRRLRGKGSAAPSDEQQQYELHWDTNRRASVKPRKGKRENIWMSKADLSAADN